MAAQTTVPSRVWSLNTTAFTCANVGANTVTLTLSDAAGNTSSCNATVTVQDVTPPTALCQNVTVSLDGAGTASLTGAMLNNGSSDICGIASLNPSVTSFTCNNLNTSKLFISDADRVFKTDLLGNNRTNLNPLAAALYTLAVVPSKDSVYIANFNQGKLQRVHLNGGTVTDIKTGVQPFGIAVDHLAGKIYWADPNANTISRCNMDGSGTQVIISGAGEADYSRMIKLDLTNGKIYWTDANLGTVKRANLDGTGLQTIVTGQGNIVGLDLDVAANKLYFSSYSFSQIKRTNLDGTGLTVIVAAAGSVPLGLALDIPAGKIYWVNGTGGNTLKRCDLNGSNQVTLQSGMNLPYDIGLIPAMPVVLTVTDVNANAATCTGFVNVQDLIVPTISCPSNISANNSLGVCTATVTYATPVGTDNCASTTTQTTGLASGAAFPVGVTTNTFSRGRWIREFSHLLIYRHCHRQRGTCDYLPFKYIDQQWCGYFAGILPAANQPHRCDRKLWRCNDQWKPDTSSSSYAWKRRLPQWNSRAISKWPKYVNAEYRHFESGQLYAESRL
jgi:hypothetical protein